MSRRRERHDGKRKGGRGNERERLSLSRVPAVVFLKVSNIK